MKSTNIKPPRTLMTPKYLNYMYVYGRVCIVLISIVLWSAPAVSPPVGTCCPESAVPGDSPWYSCGLVWRLPAPLGWGLCWWQAQSWSSRSTSCWILPPTFNCKHRQKLVQWIHLNHKLVLKQTFKDTSRKWFMNLLISCIIFLNFI